MFALPESTNKAHFLMYCDPIYGVKIQYPSNWTVDNGNNLSYDGVTKIVGFIKDPYELAGDFWISVHNLTNKYVTNHIGLEELINGTIDYYKVYYHNFNLIESNTSDTISNTSNSAYRIIWIDEEGPYTIKTMQMGTIIGDLIYTIRYYAEMEEYSDNLPLIEMMIDSLRISNDTTQHRCLDGLHLPN
jgi:eukaryotic-like serine/threonine-protein kinase